MTRKAEQHLAKAQEYVARGEEFYRKAAAEIVAAQKADPTLSNREIGEWFGHSEHWVRKIVAWSTSATTTSHGPFGGPEEVAKADTRDARRVLREAPIEHVEHIIDQLPPERKRAVAAAAGNSYLKARQDYDEEERSLSHAERAEREIAQDAITKSARTATAGFTALGIIGHLEQATDELRELNNAQRPDRVPKVTRGRKRTPSV